MIHVFDNTTLVVNSKEKFLELVTVCKRRNLKMNASKNLAMRIYDNFEENAVNVILDVKRMEVAKAYRH